MHLNNFRIVHNPEKISGIRTMVINTCGFIRDAKQESIDTILEYVQLKKAGKINHLFVMGCLSERYKEQLRKEIPEVDEYFGVNNLEEIIVRVGGEYKRNLIGERRLTTPSHFAYLKIAEGCDRQCSFCAIPLIRGKHRSRPLQEILTEAKTLVSNGVKELNIISQDTTYYGFDFDKRKHLPELLSGLAEIQGLDWIRLHYTYPDGFPLSILDVMKHYPNICKYIDIPLQHISPRILRSMRRGASAKETIRLISKIRETIPEIALRTSLIVGYPGESKREFDELAHFVSEQKFDRLGVFTYSHEEDTHSYNLKDNIRPMIKNKRAAEIMSIQESISLEKNLSKTGTMMKVIVDREENDFYIGRTEFDSPEVDNEVLIRKTSKLKTGSFYKVKIVEALNFDLVGEIVLK